MWVLQALSKPPGTIRFAVKIAGSTNMKIMKTPSQDTADEKLSSLLRDSRPAPGLPPRFQENVWRRIEQPETRHAPVVSPSWIDALAVLLMKPRFAMAGVAALVLAGALFGSIEGTTHARQHAQERYLAKVAPEALH